MLNQILANALIEDGLLTFILGLLVTFTGILTIVLFVKIIGGFFVKNNKEPVKKETVIKVEEKPIVDNNEVPEHVKVAIIAAITAYYSENENKSKADFIVRRIKRI